MQYLLYEKKLDLTALLARISSADSVYLKFLSANDMGLTGSHQSGIYMGAESWPMFLSEPGTPGQNYKKEFTIYFEGVHPVSAVYNWYGEGSRSEYRLTRIKSYFRGHEERYTGSLFALIRNEDRFEAWVLEHEEEMETVLNLFGISPAETNRVIRFDLEDRLMDYFDRYLNELKGSPFPDTDTLTNYTRQIFEELYGKDLTDPDWAILELIRIEYALFRAMERLHYGKYLERPFRSLDELQFVSLQINNRRKSRAGRSLENHLAYIFRSYNLPFSHGQTTSEGKRPDFIFPGVDRYNDPGFPEEKLYVLGAKTTCKDRWRQVINEADRVSTRYLFTLQQGITGAQLREMHLAGVLPVMPAEYFERCRAQDRHYLLNLKEFIEILLEHTEQEPVLFL